MGNCGKCIILSLHCTHLGTGVRATVEEISMEVEDLGLPAAKKSTNFRAALIHLGNELVKNELVSLFKKAGLSKQDINIL